MLACPRCGSAAAIRIQRDATRPWEQSAEGTGARWRLHCEDCGADWSMTDGA